MSNSTIRNGLPARALLTLSYISHLGIWVRFFNSLIQPRHRPILRQSPSPPAHRSRRGWVRFFNSPVRAHRAAQTMRRIAFVRTTPRPAHPFKGWVRFFECSPLAGEAHHISDIALIMLPYYRASCNPPVKLLNWYCTWMAPLAA